MYISDDDTFALKKCTEIDEEPPTNNQLNKNGLLLFNFSNLSTSALVQIFANIFPQLLCGTTIMNLDIKMTFFEFFEAFIACAEESIRVKEEELKLREIISQMRYPE